VLSPQQATVPSLWIAHVWEPPELIETKVPPGAVACPDPLRPQQVAVPSLFRAQVW